MSPWSSVRARSAASARAVFECAAELSIVHPSVESGAADAGESCALGEGSRRGDVWEGDYLFFGEAGGEIRVICSILFHCVPFLSGEWNSLRKNGTPVVPLSVSEVEQGGTKWNRGVPFGRHTIQAAWEKSGTTAGQSRQKIIARAFGFCKWCGSGVTVQTRGDGRSRECVEAAGRSQGRGRRLRNRPPLYLEFG